MPIPPRSVRLPGYHVRRSSASPSLLYVDDVRAEMALLPQSAPNASSTSGVKLAQIVGKRASTPPARKHEVPLAALIDGRGRPPRSGTALGLGYDVVPRPEVVALDDEHASTDTPRVPAMPTPREANANGPRNGNGGPRRASDSRSPTRSPRLVPRKGGTPPLSSGMAASAGSTGSAGSSGSVAGSPRRFWSWGEPTTPALAPQAPDEDEWEYVCVEDGVVGDLELEVAKHPPAAPPAPYAPPGDRVSYSGALAQ